MGSPLLPIGARFAECYTLFNFHVNTQLLARPDVQRSHAIDGKTFPLLDCRYIPGNGQQVAGGLTVWTGCKTYMWMSAMVLGLCELLQKNGTGPLLIAMECTELFTFTSFLQMGAPVVANMNLLAMASVCTSSPLRWVTFQQTVTQPGQPPHPIAPAAVIVDDTSSSFDAYRDVSLPVRSPSTCG